MFSARMPVSDPTRCYSARSFPVHLLPRLRHPLLQRTPYYILSILLFHSRRSLPSACATKSDMLLGCQWAKLIDPYYHESQNLSLFVEHRLAPIKRWGTPTPTHPVVRPIEKSRLVIFDSGSQCAVIYVSRREEIQGKRK